ncbi:MAG TPA: J domain-containing protein [Dehalococcoidia bacterium]|nr:J domain-containing protein [Dehalococcoidia bacterium]
MLTHYLVLGLSPQASTTEVRPRYLQLVRENPPGRAPEYFQKVTAAYEALKDEPTRVATTFLGARQYADVEMALLDLVRARPSRRKGPGLKALLAAEGILDE